MVQQKSSHFFATEMTEQHKLYTFCGLISFFVILFDQATKFAVLALIPSNALVSVCRGVNLVLTFNYGTSCGLLIPNNIVQFYMIVALTLGCIIFVLYMLLSARNTVEKFLCSVLIGGAIGNLIDRFIHGAVVDFVDIHYKTWHWPAFNFADTCISCSVIAMIAYNMLAKEQ